MKKTCYLLLWILCLATGSRAATLYIPMNADDQNNHLKAYGIAFIALKSGMTVDWLINYDGGAFAMQQNAEVERLCRLRGVRRGLVLRPSPYRLQCKQEQKWKWKKFDSHACSQ